MIVLVVCFGGQLSGCPLWDTPKRREGGVLPEIHLDMTEADFDLLCVDTTAWSGTALPAQRGRFEPVMASYETSRLTESWRVAYWLAYRWGDVMWCRAFLASFGEEYEVVVSGDDEPSFVILTDYETASWKETQ